MSNIKKRQHYVWRKYLKSWTSDESIWTYFKKLDKIQRPNLMGVAQEKYFYKLVDFTTEEEIFLRLFIERLAEDLKAFNLEFLSLFTTTTRIKKELINTTNILIDKNIINEEIRKLEINLMEDVQSKTEELGFKLINYRSLDELKTILEDDYIYDAMMFLCAQYYRTRNMKNLVLNGLKDKKHAQLIEKSWNIISHCLGITLAKRIALHPNLKFILFENKTSNHFITSDQPVFNLLKDKLNDKGGVEDLELYYPLGPSYALNIHFRISQKEQFEKQNISEERAGYLNIKMFENSDFCVFANTKEQLQKLKI